MNIEEDKNRELNVANTVIEEGKLKDVIPPSVPPEIRASFQLNRVVLLGLLFTTLLVVGVAVIMFSQFVKQKPANPVGTTESSPSATPAARSEEAITATESATIEEEKGEISITVLNGSNIAGMAASIRDRLTTIGFTNIEIGNAKGQSVEETNVRFAKSVSSPIRDLVVAELEKVFLTVVAEEHTSGLALSIEITTGTELVNP